MISFELSTHVFRPLPQVFTFVATPENDFQWQYGTLTSAQISSGAVALGTLFRAVGHLMGWRIETVYEVNVFEPNRKYGFKSVSGPVNSQMLYTFEMFAGGTKINFSSGTDPGDLYKPSDVIFVKKLKKQYKENLAMLKNVLEARQILRT